MLATGLRAGPGTLQMAASSSISSQHAPRTSPERTAVNTRSSRQSRTPAAEDDSRAVASAFATSRCGRVLKWRDCLPFLGSAAVIASSARGPWAMAHRVTAPIRSRPRPRRHRLLVPDRLKHRRASQPPSTRRTHRSRASVASRDSRTRARAAQRDRCACRHRQAHAHGAEPRRARTADDQLRRWRGRRGGVDVAERVDRVAFPLSRQRPFTVRRLRRGRCGPGPPVSRTGAR